MHRFRKPPLVKKGLSSFIFNFLFTISKYLFTQKVEDYLELACLTLAHNQFYQQDWQRIFLMMYESEIDTLKIESLQTSIYNTDMHDDLFYCFVEVKFHNLRVLNLFCCAVVSIEAFAWLDMPNLERFQSVYNYINCYKALAKFASTMYLRDVFLYSHVNTRPDIRVLHRIKSMFSCMGLEIKGNALIACQDLSILAKIPTFIEYRRSSMTVKIKKNKRIKQNYIKDLLRRNFVHSIKFIEADGQTAPANFWDLNLIEMLGVGFGFATMLQNIHYG